MMDLGLQFIRFKELNDGSILATAVLMGGVDEPLLCCPRTVRILVEPSPFQHKVRDDVEQHQRKERNALKKQIATATRALKKLTA